MSGVVLNQCICSAPIVFTRGCKFAGCGRGRAGMQVVALSLCLARLRLAPLTLSCLSSDMHHWLSLWADASGRRSAPLPVLCDSVCGSSPVFVSFFPSLSLLWGWGRTSDCRLCHRWSGFSYNRRGLMKDMQDSIAFCCSLFLRSLYIPSLAMSKQNKWQSTVSSLGPALASCNRWMRTEAGWCRFSFVVATIIYSFPGDVEVKQVTVNRVIAGIGISKIKQLRDDWGHCYFSAVFAAIIIFFLGGVVELR